MDQNAIRLTKLYYKKSLMELVIGEHDVSVCDLLRKINLKTALILLRRAWDKITADVITKCWTIVLNGITEIGDNSGIPDENDDDNIPLARIAINLINGNSRANFSQELNNIVRTAVMRWYNY